MQLTQASRKKAKIKMALQGPSGAGKTMSALLIAYGLCGSWERIAVIDTENHSADLYAHLGAYQVLSIGAPFSPEKYTEALQLCVQSGMEVVIIDSVSHEWEGSGGILDIHSRMQGNSFTNWGQVTPRHNAFVQAILQSSVHIIGTIRSKQDYVLSEKNGKMIPEKVGLKGVTKDGLDYEFTLVLDINIKHYATASKDRTGLFIDQPEFKPAIITGSSILEWCNEGVASIEERINRCASVEELLKLYEESLEYQRTHSALFSARKAQLQNTALDTQPETINHDLNHHPMEYINEHEIVLHMDNAPIHELPEEPSITSSTTIPERAFIEANTIRSTFEEMKREHVIPVFIKDNEPVISHVDFIETVQEAAADIFRGETILSPSVRLSHPIKGRIPEAKNKPAKELLEHEKTLYYERMAFTIEIASVQENVSGNALKLMVGGVKAYNQDNLYNKKGADEHFKVFIGFQNSVCTNLCVWSDGYVGDMKVKDAGQLKTAILKLFYNYDMHQQLSFLHGLDNYSLTESQFAQLMGRCRLYQHLSYQQKQEIPALHLSDTQLNAVAKDYYRDGSFCRDISTGDINLWRLYNLFTGANKSSYIDTFLDRTVNATSFIAEIKSTVANDSQCWFLQ